MPHRPRHTRGGSTTEIKLGANKADAAESSLLRLKRKAIGAGKGQGPAPVGIHLGEELVLAGSTMFALTAGYPE